MSKDDSFSMDALESRVLLSSGLGRFPLAMFGGPGGHGHLMNTIQFNQAPAKVQAGLDALATKDGLTAPDPTSTQTVYLNNVNGVETFTMDFVSTGTETELTVDQNGTAFTRPVRSSTTWGVLSGTGAGSNAAAAGEIGIIATALGLAAPTANTPVKVVTASDGYATYSVLLKKATSGNHWWQNMPVLVSVDSNGNPVGNQNLPFSAIPTAIQNGINANLPTGTAPFGTDSTQVVNVRTAFGATSYSVTFTSSSGTQTTVTVDSTGALHNLPSRTKVQFQNIPAAAQATLQSLATADGFSGTIAATQTVIALDEANGTTVYSLSLTIPKTTASGRARNIVITVASDQLGNPTKPPKFRFGGWHRRWEWF